MLSLIASLVAKSFFAKPRVTKEVAIAGILAVVAFLFFSIGLVFGFSSLENFLIAEGLKDYQANFYISIGCIATTLALAFIASIKLKKAKEKKEDGFDKLVNLAESFMEGFSNAPQKNDVQGGLPEEYQAETQEPLRK